MALHDLLDLVKLDYNSFMSKVEKYSKPNLIVAEKAIALVEKEDVPSANYSSGGRDKKSDRSRDDEIATVVARKDICCVTILVDKNIETENNE